MGIFSSRDIGQTSVISPAPVIQATQSIHLSVSGPSRRLSMSSRPSRSRVFTRPSQVDNPGPQPLERVPTEPANVYAPAHQPTPEELVRDGIKVRDFAYEKSSLPPVPVVRRPIIRELKRARDETEEEREWRVRNEARRIELTTARMRPAVGKGNINGLGDIGNVGGVIKPNNAVASTSAVKLQDLQRQPTEPVIQPSESRLSTLDCPPSVLHTPRRPPRPSSPLHFTNWLQIGTGSQSPSQSSQCLQSQSQSQYAGSSQLPHLSISQTDSEMDDEYVKTPLVTPNGSLVFMDDDSSGGADVDSSAMPDAILDTSELPESQIEPMLAVSQNPTGVEGDVTASQMGLSESQSQSQPLWQQISHQSPLRQGRNSDDTIPDSQDLSQDSLTPPRQSPVFKTPSPRIISPAPLFRRISASASPSIPRRRSFTSPLPHSNTRQSLVRSSSRNGPSLEQPHSHMPSVPHTSPIRAIGNARESATVAAASAVYNMKLRARSPRKMSITSRTSAHARSNRGVGVSKGKSKAHVDDESAGHAIGLTHGSPSARPLRRSTRERR